MTPPAASTSNLPQFHVVGFSGHRQLADMNGVRVAIQTALESLRGENPGEWIALSSVAAGADLLFVHAAADLGMGWEALLPLPLIDFERDFAPEEWVEVKAMLARAERVEVAIEPGSREEAYLTGGLEIVNHCDVLLVVWDGQPARGKGGTGDVVNYARAMGRPILIVNPETKAVRKENFEPLRLQDASLSILNSVPGKKSFPAANSQQLISAFQRKVDAAAPDRSLHFRKLIAIMVWLYVCATVLTTASLVFGWHWGGLPWGVLFLLLGAGGLGLIVRTQRRDHQQTHCRLAVEISRSALATWGLPRTTRLFADFDWLGLEPLRRSLDVLHRRAARVAGTDFETFRQQYLDGRIHEQLAHFIHQETRAIRWLARLRLGFTVSSIGAVGFTALHAINLVTGRSELAQEAEDTLYYFSAIILPVLAATFISLTSIHDLQQRVARYREICIRLENAQKEITHSQTWAGLERAIDKAERVLLQEVFARHAITPLTASH